MAKAGSTRRLRSGFNLGGEQAEADPLLQRAFFTSGHYTAVASPQEPQCFLIGRTGSGKTAVLQRLEEENPDHVIRINPEDLSLPYITELGVVRHLAQMQVRLDPLFIALWKHVLLVEIIRHRYRVDSPSAKQNFFNSLYERVKRDKSKAAALEYLDDFEGKFWCETDERVRDITQNFEKQVQAAAGAKVAIPQVGEVTGNIDGVTKYATEVRTEQAERYQRIVNATQLPRLNKMMSVLDEDILDSPQHYTYIVIDDL